MPDMKNNTFNYNNIQNAMIMQNMMMYQYMMQQQHMQTSISNQNIIQQQQHDIQQVLSPKSQQNSNINYDIQKQYYEKEMEDIRSSPQKI